MLDSWKTIREDTATAVEDLPDGDLDFRPNSDLMTFREISRHILEASDGLCGIMLAGVENLQTPQFREMLKEYISPLPAEAGAGAIAIALRESMKKRCGEFTEKTPDFYSGMITRFDGQRVTRLEMLQFIKEHELTHRSQLFLYLRLKGIVPPTTRRRQAKK